MGFRFKCSIICYVLLHRLLQLRGSSRRSKDTVVKKTHSVELNPVLFKSHPNFFSSFTPRIHEHAALADGASLQCQVDICGQKNVGVLQGCVAPIVGNMTALILPDCTPDRLRRIAYFLEISFIQDDIGDAQDLDPKLRERFSHGVKEALKVAVLGFLRDDPEMGVELMKQWKKWGNAQKQTASEVVRAKDVDGYLELRYEDGAMNMMIPIIQFANNIKLSDELIATLDPATKLIATSAILTNDYLSWEKESMSYQGDKRSDSDVPLNTIAFYKHTHGMSTEEARQTVRAKSMQLELEYIQVRDDILAQQGGDLQSFEFDNAIAWFDQLEHLVSGLHAWSLYSLRYHKADVNPYKDLLQLKE